MEDFMKRTAEYAMSEDNQPAPNAEEWASTAFSVLSVLGGHASVNEEVGDKLAQLLSKADDHTVMAGTIKLVTATMKVSEALNDIENIEVPDDLSGLDDTK